jgi:hypothetical protein
MEELDDRELNSILEAWKVAGAPRPMRAPWWKRSVQVPLPLAAAVFLAIVYGVVRLATPAPAVVRWEPVKEIKVRIIRSHHVSN